MDQRYSHQSCNLHIRYWPFVLKTVVIIVSYSPSAR